MVKSPFLRFWNFPIQRIRCVVQPVSNLSPDRLSFLELKQSDDVTKVPFECRDLTPSTLNGWSSSYTQCYVTTRNLLVHKSLTDEMNKREDWSRFVVRFYSRTKERVGEDQINIEIEYKEVELHV